MNLKNGFSNSTIFLPDPWTDTVVNAGNDLKKIHNILKKMVLENASNTVIFRDFVHLFSFAVFKMSFNFKFFIFKNF